MKLLRTICTVSIFLSSTLCGMDINKNQDQKKYHLVHTKSLFNNKNYIKNILKKWSLGNRNNKKNSYTKLYIPKYSIPLTPVVLLDNNLTSIHQKNN